MTFIPNKELQGINSDQYEAPSENCSCSAATIAVAIDRATGAQLVKGAADGKVTAAGGTQTVNVADGSLNLDAYAFTIVEDATFTSITAPNDASAANMVGPNYSAGAVYVIDVTQVQLASGVVCFYLNEA